jgi:phosphotransferase system  glucose/maltose/N-acetylglucosamine-specific IIC component
MDTTIIAALIGIVGVIIAAIAAYWAAKKAEERRWRREEQEKKERQEEEEAKKIRRELLNGVPEFLEAKDYDLTRPTIPGGWDRDGIPDYSPFGAHPPEAAAPSCASIIVGIVILLIIGAVIAYFLLY